jgi:hypothetical protein
MTTAAIHPQPDRPRLRRRRLVPATLAIALAAAGAFVLPTDASARRDRHRDGGVVACSHYGRGCIRAPVRHGRVERQVRMPGGTWIGCKTNCQRTLREESLDFFETLNDRVWDN